jgi:predicted dehydrogenase
MGEIGVGIIGAGVRGVYCLGHAIAELHEQTGLVVSGVCDLIRERSSEAKHYLEDLYREKGFTHEVRVHDDYRDLLEDEACPVVLVTSFTSEHRAHAVDALKRGKKVYLDKPISVTRVDAADIVEAAGHGPLMMGFTRRYEKSWVTAKKMLDTGVIGALQMMEISSVVPYSRYLQTWHRRKELSGGSINDKCSHHFDVFNWMAGERPEYLTAVGGRSSVFPVEEDAPASCRQCSRECPYRRDPNKVSDGGFVLQFDSWKKATDETAMIDNCVYAPGAEINDHALVSVVYPSGVKASLFFSIFGPDTNDQETLLLVGERGRIMLTRHEGLVTVDSSFGATSELFDCRGEEFETSHFGADRDLVRALREFHDGRRPVASAADGYLSLEMVLAAQESIQRCGQPVQLGTVPDVRLN